MANTLDKFNDLLANHSCFQRIVQLLYRRFPRFYKFAYWQYKQLKERRKLKKISAFVKPGSTVLDVGANVGYFSEKLAQMVGKQGKVFAFEPESENFNRLLDTTQKYPQVIALNKAVGGQNMDVSLYGAHFNVDYRCYPSQDHKGSIQTVEQIRLDCFVQQMQLDLDFIKVDVQGYEVSVLDGMSELTLRPGLTLCLEFWPYALRQQKKCPLKFLDKLQGLGFKILDPSPTEVDELARSLRYKDYSDLILRYPEEQQSH